MKKLSLDAFKAKMNQEESKKAEELIGGILGACHYKCYNLIGNEVPCPEDCVCS